MWFYILAALVFYIATTTKEKPLTWSPSEDIYKQMVDNGEDADVIRAYLEMEAELITETNPSRALILSVQIKEAFPKYDFGHHTTLIKFIATNYSSQSS